MKAARNMTDAELAAAIVRSNAEIDEHEAAQRADDYEGHGGSPGEGMYERHEELIVERKRRRKNRTR